MGILQKRLGSWARWWKTEIKVNPTQVSAHLGHPVDMSSLALGEWTNETFEPYLRPWANPVNTSQYHRLTVVVSHGLELCGFLKIRNREWRFFLSGREIWGCE